MQDFNFVIAIQHFQVPSHLYASFSRSLCLQILKPIKIRLREARLRELLKKANNCKSRLENQPLNFCLKLGMHFRVNS